jgi:hypothetical protein
MALNIWGGADAPKAEKSGYQDDVVGRFRGGHQLGNQPVALQEWRVTTGDPEVADKVHEILGGDAPQEWEAKGEDNLEVFTASSEVEIIIEKPSALRQRMVLWGRNGKLIQAGDGQTLDYPEDKKGQPDPDAMLSFQERKQKGRDGTGPEPSIELIFRLAEEPDLGLFRYQTGSWSLVSDLAYNGVEDALAEIDGPAKAVLALEEVSFVAKNGPRAGQTVNYTKPTLKIVGPVEA